MQIVKGGTVSALLKTVPIPKMFHAKQEFPKDRIDPRDIPPLISRELSKPEFGSKIRPGMQIAITAGSRGIRNVNIITKAIADFVKLKGAVPFIVPAMGSHGGANAQGQKDMLAGFGITEESMGCEIRSSMEVVKLGVSDTGRTVYMDKNAYGADGVIISCRLKPHNAFRGTVESGPCKMMTVGLGKQKGAEEVHSDGMDRIAQNIPSMAKVVLEKAPILFAVPCVENAYDETCLIEAIAPENILTREAELLQFAFSNMPSILVGSADVLVVDEIGKNYSGTGTDPNITGTFSTPYATGGLKVQRTCFLRLSEVSHGNALGVGLASCITKEIFEQIDPEAMYPNCITSTVLRSAMIPVVVATEKEAVSLCIRTLNKVDKNRVRMVRIPNSLHISEIMLSEEYYERVKNYEFKGVEALDKPEVLAFDEQERLTTPYLTV
ncbi:DUF362 domain-containing protein [Clostridium sp. KNHs216]|uniref:DUF362 domain-containing protein n=1 Tax=Clostridium sp. KNHs216 TaxID=1550235 RepID=UPI001153A16E|nr:DUF362 domain-containing protein [Clostridium sp. KNHs216]TQI67032.1 hypothetical protein LY85_1716 [Clostridium sp. KNHs216]